MPSAPPRPCANQRCPNLTTGTRCEQCAKAHDKRRYTAYDERRESSSRRGYSRDWYRWLNSFRRGVDLADDDPDLAAKIIARNRCAACGTRERLDYDHIVPLRQGGARLDPANVQALCRAHHQAKTRREG